MQEDFDKLLMLIKDNYEGINYTTNELPIDILRNNDEKTEEKTIHLLSDSLEGEIFCPYCGAKNYALRRVCTKCEKTLPSYLVNPARQFTSFEEFINEKSINTIKEVEINEDVMNTINRNILNASFRYGYDANKNAYENLLDLCRYYVNVIFDDKIKSYGSYAYNTLFVNSNNPLSKRAVYIIILLARDIYAEILTEIIQYIFDVEKNTFVESFVNYMFINKFHYYMLAILSLEIEKKLVTESEVDYTLLENMTTDLDSDLEKAIYSNLKVYLSYVGELLEAIIPKEVFKELLKEFRMDSENFSLKFDKVEITTFESIVKTEISAAISSLIEKSENRELLNKIKMEFESVHVPVN